MTLTNRSLMADEIKKTIPVLTVQFQGRAERIKYFRYHAEGTEIQMADHLPSPPKGWKMAVGS
jgi:hypothetical protein